MSPLAGSLEPEGIESGVGTVQARSRDHDFGCNEDHIHKPNAGR